MTDYNDLDNTAPDSAPPPASGSNNRLFIALIAVFALVLIGAVAVLIGYVVFLRPQSNIQRSTQAAQINAQNTAVIQTGTSAVLAQGQTVIPKLTTNTPVPPTATPKATSTSPAAPTNSEAPSLVPTSGEATSVVATNEVVTTAIPTSGAATSSVSATGPTAANPTAGVTLSAAGTFSAASGSASTTPTKTPAVLVDARTATVQVLLTQAAMASGQTTSTLVPGTTATALPTTGFAEDAGLPGLLGISALLIVVIFLARRMRAAN